MSQAEGPPPEQESRHRHVGPEPALGTRGEPGHWRRAFEGATVALARSDFGDARAARLYGEDTRYADRAADGRVGEAAARMRGGDVDPGAVHGPVIHPAVWTWEVPLYFFAGGVATGSAFVATAADAAGDRRSARIARRVTLAATLPTAPLLIMDLGRPGRFLNMLRIFKPRSPMSTGAWCLVAFSALSTGSVAADVAGRRHLARGLGAGTALFGTYLGSYAGVLLASTAVPAWARSRLFLGPIFIATATGTGAAANSFVLAASGVAGGHPTMRALRAVEGLAMASELALSRWNERRLGPLAAALEEGRPGALFRLGKWTARAGLATRLARGRGGPWPGRLASALFLASGLAFRFAWVGAGRSSATDDEAVARTARERRRP